MWAHIRFHWLKSQHLKPLSFSFWLNNWNSCHCLHFTSTQIFCVKINTLFSPFAGWRLFLFLAFFFPPQFNLKSRQGLVYWWFHKMDQYSIHLFRGIIPLPLSDCLEKLWKAIFSNLAVVAGRLLPSNPKRTGSLVPSLLLPLPSINAPSLEFYLSISFNQGNKFY